jgi:hypothetical protein
MFHLRRNNLHEAAQRIVAVLGMERWTPHDLRRTAATILDRSGYSLEEIGPLLAHTRKGVTAVYARWDKFGSAAGDGGDDRAVAARHAGPDEGEQRRRVRRTEKRRGLTTDRHCQWSMSGRQSPCQRTAGIYCRSAH